MARSGDDGRCRHGAEGAPLDRADTGGGAVIIAVRLHTLLPLDDGLYGLRLTIPHLTCSSLRGCLSRLPEMDGDKPEKKCFTEYAIGYLRVDIAEVRTEGGRL